ncbi:unnamed protein product [Coregonus sp. 'balchen']|nr:unnamed protein product [Coregonus sp. 'balchen']
MVKTKESAENSCFLQYVSIRAPSPAETDSSPVKTDSSPVETDSSPVETDSSPVETDSSPIETDSSPVESDSSPVETDSSPVETDSSPVETDSLESHKHKQLVRIVEMGAPHWCLQWTRLTVNPFLLPGVRLGYRILDSCGQHPWSLRGALALVVRGEPQLDSPVPLVIGDSSSTQAIILARTLGPLSVPMISYQATCGCLSDRQEFPNFFRTIPSDVYQALTMARLTWLFGWTWVGAIAADNDYGRQAMQVFEEAVRGTGVCLAFFETLNRVNLVRDVERAADTVQASTARVILVFLLYTDMGAEAWSTSGQLLRNPALFNVSRGVVGVAIRSAPMPGFEAHLRSLHPSRRPGDVLLKELWETEFGCSPGAADAHGMSLLPSPLPPSPSVSISHTPPPTSSSPRPRLASCSGAETLEDVQSSFTDTSQLRVTYNVYLAVYAAAHALHSLLSCPQRDSPTWGSSVNCSPPHNISPAELLQHLNLVNFTTPLGEPFYFRGADIPAVYDLVNWQATPKGLLKLVTIGRVEGFNILINQSAIQWNAGSNMVPVSVCSGSCPPGTRVARRKGEPVCCFDCIPCAEGEVSNTTGSLQCDGCPLEFWSNGNRTACIPRQFEFLSFNDTMGVTLTTIAVCGTVATAAVFMLFVYHRHTPLVRANNSELSFLLLLSLKLCFLCSLVFIGRPSAWACQIRQAAFGGDLRALPLLPPGQEHRGSGCVPLSQARCWAADEEVWTQSAERECLPLYQCSGDHLCRVVVHKSSPALP